MRIAILGICLESHARADVTGESAFLDFALCRGDEVLSSAYLKPWLHAGSGGGFVREMNRLGAWEPLPLLVADADAGGPCDHDFYVQCRDEILARLARCGPVDGVYIRAHGAGVTTGTLDLDGDYFEAVRRAVGPATPIVATLDLHANVSDRLVAAADALIALRTNPHVDMPERGAEAARVLRRLIAGDRLYTAHVRLPLLTPQVAQRTDPDTEFGRLIAYAESFLGDAVISVSVLPGFAFSDTPHNGMTIVTVATHRDAADQTAARIAQRAWDGRAAYRPELISVDDAVEIARSASHARPAILADVADNPGGGAPGNTMWILKAMLEAGVDRCLVGMVRDPEVAILAHAAGEGATLHVTFNASIRSEYSRPLAVRAEVLALRDGRFEGRFGVGAGMGLNLGRSCLLRCQGIEIVVVSTHQQVLGPEFFTYFGCDVRDTRSFVLKSRGHFRAGFAGISDRIFEVDAPGLLTPHLERVEWKNLARPIYPLDTDTRWPSHSP